MGKTKHSRSFEQKLIQATGYKGLRRAEEQRGSQAGPGLGATRSHHPPELEKQEGRERHRASRGQAAAAATTHSTQRGAGGNTGSPRSSSSLPSVSRWQTLNAARWGGIWKM